MTFHVFDISIYLSFFFLFLLLNFSIFPFFSFFEFCTESLLQNLTKCVNKYKKRFNLISFTHVLLSLLLFRSHLFISLKL
jgi:hypothetical protein